MTTKIFPKFDESANQNFSKKNSGGFTLLETMVALAILLIAVVGPISLLGGALQQIYFARDQMIAVNLAQEGIEVVRVIRDTNMLRNPASPTAWLLGLDSKQYTLDTLGYIYDMEMNLCAGATCTLAETQVYRYGTPGNYFYRQKYIGESTPFYRVVTIDNATCNGSTTECKITSRVTWKTGGLPGTVEISEYIFNWAKP